MLHFLLLIILAGVGLAMSRTNPHAGIEARLAFGLGFLVMGSYLAGEITRRLSAPRITGYLLVGLFFGPFAFKVIDSEVVSRLKLVDELALCFIAFAAGGELEIKKIRSRIRAMIAVAVGQLLIVVPLLAGVTLAMALALGGLDGLTVGQTLVVGCLLGLVAYPTGLASTMGVVLETGARGLVAETVVGTTIVKELIDIVLFTMVSGFAVSYMGNGVGSGMARLLGEIFLSLTAGGIFGAGAWLYFEKVGRDLAVFTLGLAFFMIMIARVFHLETMLVAMSAGFVVTNFSKEAARFIESIEHASAPVFIIFFAIAGASLDVRSLGWAWVIAVGFVVVRWLGLWGGTRAGLWMVQRSAGEFHGLRTKGWTGFLGHAGLSLGLLSMMVDMLPRIAGHLAGFVVAAVLLSEVAGPIAFKSALVRLGEGS